MQNSTLFKIILGCSIVLNCVLLARGVEQPDKSEMEISSTTFAQIQYELSMQKDMRINSFARYSKYLKDKRIPDFTHQLKAVDSVYAYYLRQLSVTDIADYEAHLMIAKQAMIHQLQNPVSISEELADSLMYTYQRSTPPLNKTESTLQLLLAANAIIDYGRRSWSICEIPIDHATVVIDSSIFIAHPTYVNYEIPKSDSISIQSVILENEGIPLSRCHIYRSGSTHLIKVDVPEKLLTQDALLYLKLDYHMGDEGTFTRHYTYVLWDTGK